MIRKYNIGYLAIGIIDLKKHMVPHCRLKETKNGGSSRQHRPIIRSEHT